MSCVIDVWLIIRLFNFEGVYLSKRFFENYTMYNGKVFL